MRHNRKGFGKERDHTTVYVRKDLIDAAKARNINISEVLEKELLYQLGYYEPITALRIIKTQIEHDIKNLLDARQQGKGGFSLDEVEKILYSIKKILENTDIPSRRNL